MNSRTVVAIAGKPGMGTALSLAGAGFAMVLGLAGCGECTLARSERDREACEADAEDRHRQEMLSSAVDRIGTGTPIDTQLFPYQNGLQLDLHGCGRVNAAQVVCLLAVTALSFDWKVEVDVGGCFFSEWTRGIDDLGNSYKPSQVSVADDQSTSLCLNHEFATGFTIPMTVTFPNVHAGADSFVRLKLAVNADRGQGSSRGEVVFYDVPILN